MWVEKGNEVMRKEKEKEVELVQRIPPAVETTDGWSDAPLGVKNPTRSTKKVKKYCTCIPVWKEA